MSENKMNDENSNEQEIDDLFSSGKIDDLLDDLYPIEYSPLDFSAGDLVLLGIPLIILAAIMGYLIFFCGF